MKLFSALICLLLVLALGAVPVSAAPARRDRPVTPLVVAMHDPGCHWFLVRSSYARAARVAGPVRLENRDEATIKVASRAGIELVRVGKSVVLPRGHYVVMMVGQAVDDNYLKLTVS